MKLPHSFLRAIAHAPGLDLDALVKAHEVPETITSLRFNPSKTVSTSAGATPYNSITGAVDSDPVFAETRPVPWAEHAVYLPQRPSFTFDPLFHAGCYYVQEASSMFLEQAFGQHAPQHPLKVLDLSAAPGGKSTHLLSLMPPGSMLVANEVIRSRMQVLQQNIIKWGSDNAFVTNNDPAAFASLPGFFDVVVVDAPCSGSGLFRRDAAAIEEWSPAHVQLCAQRQQRILADALPALKEGGLLIYSTCSYSPEEDEDICKWLKEEFSLQPLSINTSPQWHVVESEAGGVSGYRFYPDKLAGEGFFLSCMRKQEPTKEKKIKWGKPARLSAADARVVGEWLSPDFELVPFRHGVSAIPQHLIESFRLIDSNLNLHYAGVRLGEVIRGKFVPDHALAVSLIMKSDIPCISLTLEQAISYLQRREVMIDAKEKGWHTVQYRGMNLGWINALPNRINNYYPKDLRILKDWNPRGSHNL